MRDTQTERETEREQGLPIFPCDFYFLFRYFYYDLLWLSVFFLGVQLSDLSIFDGAMHDILRITNTSDSQEKLKGSFDNIYLCIFSR